MDATTERVTSVVQPDGPRGVGLPNLSPAEHTNFSLVHKHSGIHGDGQRIGAGSIDWAIVLPAGVGIILTTPNGLHTYRIGVANNGALTSTKVT